MGEEMKPGDLAIMNHMAGVGATAFSLTYGRRGDLSTRHVQPGQTVMVVVCGERKEPWSEGTHTVQGMLDNGYSMVLIEGDVWWINTRWLLEGKT